MHCCWGYALWCSEGSLTNKLTGECIPRWVITNDTTCKVHLLKMTLHFPSDRCIKGGKDCLTEPKFPYDIFALADACSYKKNLVTFFLGFKSKDQCMLQPRKVNVCWDCVAGANDPVSHDVVHEKARWSEATRRKWPVYLCKLYIGSVDSK